MRPATWREGVPAPLPVHSAADPRVADFQSVSDPVRVRRLGLFVAEGRFVVSRVLADPRYEITGLLVTGTALDVIGDALAASGSLAPVYLASRQLIQEIGGYVFHQGCLALVSRPARIEPETLIGSDSVKPLLVLEQVGNPDNIGGIFRNAAALGAAGVLLSPGCGDPLYRKAIRTSIGATLQMPYAVLDDWPSGLGALPAHGFQVVALTPEPSATTLDELCLGRGATRRVALVLGNEGEGLTAAVMAAADERVRIPIDPHVDSLNVATAAALALHHVRRVSGVG